jgi:hypothetical protein
MLRRVALRCRSHQRDDLGVGGVLVLDSPEIRKVASPTVTEVYQVARDIQLACLECVNVHCVVYDGERAWFSGSGTTAPRIHIRSAGFRTALCNGWIVLDEVLGEWNCGVEGGDSESFPFSTVVEHLINVASGHSPVWRNP